MEEFHLPPEQLEQHFQSLLFSHGEEGLLLFDGPENNNKQIIHRYTNYIL